MGGQKICPLNLFFEKNEVVMKNNMGTVDRIIRIILALLVIVFYLTGDLSGLAAIILGIFALVFLVTSFTGFCLLYKLLNVSTEQKIAD
ncbi:MAG: hypothetical protein SCALA702_34500 [Melioribacteraceae bacterium]|jgi:uncharacterized membrane protein YkgB|nr:MAG: hypothetical protein SCALA702_34500 [Melioribacteraceae bacterium]